MSTVRSFVKKITVHTHSDGTVVAGATGDEEQSATPLDLTQVVLQTSHAHLVRLEVHATSHGIQDRLGLLEDLLLHEGREVTCGNVGERIGACGSCYQGFT